MSVTVDKILDDALTLSPAERAALVEELLSSLDKPDPALDRVWAKEAEAEARIDAAERGEMKSVPASKVFGKYD
jgi:putative addiction module component (TIGR02574 family)